MMLKNIYKNSLFALFLAIGLISCREDQEVAEVIDPSTKPLATIEPSRSVTGSINEGDTISFDVTLSKSIVNDPIVFTAKLDTGSVAGSADIVVIDGTVNPFSKTATVTVVVPVDGYPEMSETLKFQVGAYVLQQSWQLNPESEFIDVELDVNNVNPESTLSMAFTWDTEDDYDLVVVTTSGQTAALAASADNPELANQFVFGYPDGTYLYGIDPYDTPSNQAINYEIAFGYGDNVEIYEGVFDPNNTDQYESEFGLFILFEIVKSGSNFTFVNLNE